VPALKTGDVISPSLDHQESAYVRTSVIPDCAMARHLHDTWMLHSPPLTLSPEDKLDIIRYLDEFRFWRSLDDERRCTRCHEKITGRQVLVLDRPGTRGRMRLQCPTPGCASVPSEWVYANPVLFAAFKNSSARSGPSPHDDTRTASANIAKVEMPAARRRVDGVPARSASRSPGSRCWVRSPPGCTPSFRWPERTIGFFRIFKSGHRLKTGIQR